MHRLSPILVSLALAAPASAQTLRQAAEAFAGAPVALDARLAEAGCNGGFLLAWSDAAQQAVEARCVETGRRLVLPLADVTRIGGRQEPRLRRGQAVQAEAHGNGFRVRVEAVAEGGGPGGSAVGLRNSRTGQRFAGRIVEDGRILVPQADILP
jgi:hypothetical protein